MPGHEDDLCARHLSLDTASGVEAAHDRHLDIHNQNVRLQQLGLHHGLATVGCFAYDLHIWLRPEDRVD